MTPAEREAFEAQCALEQKWPVGTRVRVAVPADLYNGRTGVVTANSEGEWSHHVSIDDDVEDTPVAYDFHELALVEAPGGVVG